MKLPKLPKLPKKQQRFRQARGPVRVEVAVVHAPDGDQGVLLQLPQGYVILTGPDATALGRQLVETAESL